MRYSYIILLLLVLFVSCSDDEEKPEADTRSDPKSEIAFDSDKWQVKEGRDYPYRGQMLEDLIHNEDVRALNGNALLDVLGEPDRRNADYLYYQIDQTRLGPWPLHTKTLVIKLTDENRIEWMKVHE